MRKLCVYMSVEDRMYHGYIYRRGRSEGRVTKAQERVKDFLSEIEVISPFRKKGRKSG